jgi:predicted transcriptional regulator
VVGPTAARARGVDITWLAMPRELDVAPAPTDENLAGLAGALAAVDPRLRAGAEGLPIALSPEIFRSVPALPLTTRLGDVNVLLRPTGSPARYDDLLDDASTVELDTVPTLVPTVDALLRGLAGGAREPHPDVITQLRELASPIPELPPVAATPTTDVDDHGDLEQAVLETLGQLTYPATIRDVLFAMKTSRRPPYKQVRAAAESLTGRGWLLRTKDGTAYRYRLNTDADDKIAHDIAGLLSRSIDIEGTIARALKLVEHETPRRGTSEQQDS